MDESLLRFIVVGLVAGNADLQRHIVERYTTPDVRFVHILGSTQGRDNYLNVYRWVAGPALSSGLATAATWWGGVVQRVVVYLMCRPASWPRQWGW